MSIFNYEFFDCMNGLHGIVVYFFDIGLGGYGIVSRTAQKIYFLINYLCVFSFFCGLVDCYVCTYLQQLRRSLIHAIKQAVHIIALPATSGCYRQLYLTPQHFTSFPTSNAYKSVKYIIQEILALLTHLFLRNIFVYTCILFYVFVGFSFSRVLFCLLVLPSAILCLYLFSYFILYHLLLVSFAPFLFTCILFCYFVVFPSVCLCMSVIYLYFLQIFCYIRFFMDSLLFRRYY